MKLLLADHQAHLKFAPLTLTRPVGALRCGIYTNAERWSKWFPEAAIGFETEAYLQAKFPAVEGIKINAQVLPNEELAAALQALPDKPACTAMNFGWRPTAKRIQKSITRVKTQSYSKNAGICLNKTTPF